MSTQTPMDQVLGIQELFEKILINMDPKTLLLAQRVSLHWEYTIKNTSELQVKLFMKPSKNDDDAVSMCLELDSLCVHGDEGYAVLNPLLLSPSAASEPDEARFLLRPKIIAAIDSGKVATHSWARMLVSQPPPEYFGFHACLSRCPAHLRECYGEITEEGMQGYDAPPETTIGDRIRFAKRREAAMGVEVDWSRTQIRVMLDSDPIEGSTMLKDLQEIKRGRKVNEIYAHRRWTYHDGWGHMVPVQCGKLSKRCCIETRLREIMAG